MRLIIISVFALFMLLALVLGGTRLLVSKSSADAKLPEASHSVSSASLTDPDSSSPSEVVRKYWQLSEAGKAHEAGQLCTDTDGMLGYEKPLDKEKWSRTIFRSEFHLNRIIREEAAENMTKVFVQIVFTGGRHYVDVTHELFKQEGHWKIFNTYGTNHLIPYPKEGNANGKPKSPVADT